MLLQALSHLILVRISHVMKQMHREVKRFDLTRIKTWCMVEMTQMPTNWPVDKQKWHIHTVEYYSAIKRNEVLIHAMH